MSLKQFTQKIKSFDPERSKIVIWAIIMILVCLDVYLLGFLSNHEKVEGLELTYNSDIKIDFNKKEDLGSNGEIIASKNGTKYYFSWCSGVGRIKDENKVYFNSEQEAKSDGYSIASSCQK